MATVCKRRANVRGVQCTHIGIVSSNNVCYLCKDAPDSLDMMMSGLSDKAVLANIEESRKESISRGRNFNIVVNDLPLGSNPTFFQVLVTINVTLLVVKLVKKLRSYI